MRQALTISLPESINKQLNRYIKEENTTRSDFVREAISNHLYFKKLQKIRNKMILFAQSQGIFTDEDVFSKIS
ncbi:MAG TPA: CopG family transcriptional regulator [Spirochaetia bacterium]|nr:CopG family transcriptional regulator [Spirochaetia bacterium]